METFKELKIVLKRIGILQEDSNPNEIISSKMKFFVSFSIIISEFMSKFLFMLFVDKTDREYAENITEILFAVLYSAWYLTLFWKRQTYADHFLEL